MECALKNSFRKEMGLKSSSQQSSNDDFWVTNGENVVGCDDFFVDELLNFSNEEDEPETTKIGSLSVSGSDLEKENEEKDGDFAGKEGFGDVAAGEITVPEEDLWLSHFVEDSFSEYSAPALVAGMSPAFISGESQFKTPVLAKTRSKRNRIGGKGWSLGSPALTESSSSSGTSTSSCSSPTSQYLIYTHPNLVQPVMNRVWKKQKKTGADTVVQPPRRCSHCGVQKTPQWRTGPLGAKTLCNACGVRFKSGRLLPEYRPACSPTFSSELHSNHHRKVIEMRRKKEAPPDSGLGPQAVTSC